jgi:group I intron endonuclease
MTSKPGIYRIDGPNQKVYVGSAKNIGKRWKDHVRDLRKDGHANPKLQAAWNCHDEKSFTFTVIEVVHDLCQLLDREQFWIDSTEAATTGYNVLLVANSRLGLKATEATKRKQSLAHTGRKHGPMSEAQKAYYSQLYKGKVLSEETRRRMSEARTGRVFSDETRAKIAASNAGKVHSPETLAKMSAAKTGKKQSPELVAARMAGMKRNRLLRAEQSAHL